MDNRTQTLQEITHYIQKNFKTNWSKRTYSVYDAGYKKTAYIITEYTQPGTGWDIQDKIQLKVHPHQITIKSYHKTTTIPLSDPNSIQQTIKILKNFTKPDPTHTIFATTVAIITIIYFICLLLK